jgi:hypothetical protein
MHYGAAGDSHTYGFRQRGAAGMHATVHDVRVRVLSSVATYRCFDYHYAADLRRHRRLQRRLASERLARRCARWYDLRANAAAHRPQPVALGTDGL